MRYLFLLTLLATTASTALDYPLLDGTCEEYADLASTARTELGHDVELFVFQDDDYVWICYTLPNDSYGVLDLEIGSPGIKEPLNLHVSAQLGQWAAARPDDAPKTGNSEMWWNNVGWFANVVSFNGFKDPDAEDKQLNFRPGPGREMQLSKVHFGRGTWELVFAISSVRTTDGEYADLRHPEEGSMTLIAR